MTLESPDGDLQLQFHLSENGVPSYELSLDGSPVLQPSLLGLDCAETNLHDGFALTQVSDARTVTDDYTLIHGKQLQMHYQAQERVVELTNLDDVKLEIVFRLSDDGLAFRYRLPGSSEERWHIEQEQTGFTFPQDTRAWIQPMPVAQAGWSHTQPSYEEHYQQGVTLDTLQPFLQEQEQRAAEANDMVNVYPFQGWVFPALFEVGDNWVLLSETSVDGHYCASHLVQDAAGQTLRIGFPQEPERVQNGPVKPESALPWEMPWRLVVVSDGLGGIVESALGTDLAEPARYSAEDWMQPGHAAWSWALLKDDSIVYDVQKRFIDYAADMDWDYCLIDVYWDRNIGYDRIEELADYAAKKDVGLILWYNSSGEWNTTPYTPKGKLIDPEQRREEFARLHEMGIRGVKIDFFPGDGQSVMQYYSDLMTDAAQYELLVNFHGTTFPRGWHRTYPNLMTMESVRGFEFMTFAQFDADKGPEHMATVPFTRNVFDPMDFTPMGLSGIPNIEMRDRKDFELALSVLYYSGIQHFAETDQGMAEQPEFIRDLLRDLPKTWDETRFIDGFPGEYAVLARRSGDTWYIAGINAKDKPAKVSYAHARFLPRGKGEVYWADEDAHFQHDMTSLPKRMPAKGGFVAVVKAE